MKRVRRVVVTGIGIVAPNGVGKEQFWDAVINGKSGIGPITRFDASGLPCNAAGEVRDLDPRIFITRVKAFRLSRFTQLAVAAAHLAVDDAKLDAGRSAVGVCIGTSVQGTADVGETAHRAFLKTGWKALDARQSLEMAAHAASSHVQNELGFSGPLMTVASACCTGIDTIAWGADQIRAGTIDMAVVGATDAPLSAFTFGLFAAGGFLSTWTGPPAEASRPYDALRCGLVLSEGAAVLVLEELEHALDRRAQVYAEILGYSSFAETDSSHDPYDRYTHALQQAIAGAVLRSALTTRDIDYVCAHGNSHKFDDRAEAGAHRRALGAHAYRVPVSSIKSMVGQPLSAGGVMQAVATILAVNYQMVPPTINYRHSDPDCDLDYVPNKSRVVRVKHALFHSHSLGGNIRGSHSAMVIGRTNL